MVDLVLGEGAEPFPRGDLHGAGRAAFLLQVFVGELREDFHRLFVKIIHSHKDVIP